MRHALSILLGLLLPGLTYAAVETPVAPEPPLEVRKAIVPPVTAPGSATPAPAVPAPAMPAPAAPVPAPEAPVTKAVPVPDTPVPSVVAPATVSKIVFTRCEVARPAIAITFDDGPHPDFTPRLLDTLKEANIKATFFMVGRCVVTYPNIVKRMVDEGHEVASHSWSHPLLTSLGDAAVESQMRRTHDAIIKACGVTPTLYRPPYGGTRLSQRKRINEMFGYLTILWDVDPLDWQSPRTTQKVHDRVLEQTRPGSIILCHDIHETTVDAMPATLADLKARGYEFKTVTQLLELEKQFPASPDKPVVMPTIPVMPFTEPVSAANKETPVKKKKPAAPPARADRLPLVAPGEIKL